jgi:nitrate/TMAO reductase-like tetraheme cytochrome c subunit
MRKLRRLVRSKALGLLVLGFAGGLAVVAASGVALSWSSTTSFCMSCHEMRVVAEQGWMHSAHYDNPGGVVAGCSDCHVPPALLPKLWVKTRDGVKDVWVHFLGESDPEEMDWDALAESARGKIHESACLRCHGNLTPKGASIKTLVAHRENERLPEPKSCLECHREEFHGRFRNFLGGPAQDE